MSKTVTFLIHLAFFFFLDYLHGEKMPTQPTVMFLLGMACAFLNIHIGNTKP